MSKVPVSIIIPIKNEAGNLPRCLASVAWADEVFVVDSQSTDGSQQIASETGAHVVQFQFNGTWPKKKNWALENLPFKHEWIFILDADEVLPPETEAEFRAIVTDAQHPVEGYWINRRFMFMGRWLKHAYYPNWNLRLFKHRIGRYEKLTEVDTQSGDNEVHEHVVVQGKTGFLRAEMDHYAFPSVGVFVEKHNRYSNWEARVALDRYLHASEGRLQKSTVGARRKLKQIALMLPCRGLLRFLYVYVWQKGFLDGREGYYFARLHGFYEFLSEAKTYELKQEQKGRGGGSNNESLRRFGAAISATAFVGTLGGILWFTLKQNVRHDLFDVLPRPLRMWLGMHDNLGNFLVFFVLGLLTFRVSRNFAERRSVDSWCLAALITMVCTIEWVQTAIPGRDGSVHDVLTGGGGIIVAWLFSRMVRRKSEPSASVPCANGSEAAVPQEDALERVP